MLCSDEILFATAMFMGSIHPVEMDTMLHFFYAFPGVFEVTASLLSERMDMFTNIPLCHSPYYHEKKRGHKLSLPMRWTNHKPGMLTKQ